MSAHGMDDAALALTLPDGSTRSLPPGSTAGDLAHALGGRLAARAVAALTDQGLVDLATPLARGGRLELIAGDHPRALEVLRHTAAHILACAVQQLYPGTQVAIGPVIEHGFYYDFCRPEGFAPADLARIDARMREIVAADLPLTRREVPREEALALFAGLGEAFKGEIIADIDASEALTVYAMGGWLDLCRGPHLPSSGGVKAFALTHAARAYWRGDERRPQLARIYGTAFFRQAELKARLEMLAEAERRDHRRIGRERELFWFHPSAPATPFFLPDGAVVYGVLQAMIRGYWRQLGFDEVVTPQLYDSGLFERSGHLGNYADAMYFCRAGGRELGLKPMNCPAHALMYGMRPRSYRELPLRMADFGRLHRFERSGATSGLTRVRAFCQDDAHIFCREDQIGEEIATQLMMIREIYAAFGLNMRVGLSTRPARSLGREAGLDAAARAGWDALWGNAERLLMAALAEAGLGGRDNPEDGAFYGPKIDCEVEDALGRWHQLGTIQLDFGQPRRFALSFVAEHGGGEVPVMIHRAVLGTIERFMGVLIEHTRGQLPLWLAPTQLRVVPIADAQLPQARAAWAAFSGAGVRVELDGRSETLGFKVRDAQLMGVPLLAVIGGREAEAGTLSLRWRGEGARPPVALDRALAEVLEAAAVPAPSPQLLARAQPRGVTTQSSARRSTSPRDL